MANDKLISFNDPDALPGVIQKIAKVSSLDVTDEDLKKINKYTLSPLSAEDVFIFKASIADNEQDDRNFMPFNLKALQDLKKLYPGKTMLKDHDRKADNQIARIYDTELIQDANKTTELGELHTELISKMYVVKTESNKDLIAEIKGGIKKEVSTSTVPEKMICNICGADNMKDYCRHWPGMEYDVTDETGKSSKRRCKMLLYGAKDAYELSFVAVPAQPRAGTHKSIGFTKPVEEKKETPVVETPVVDETTDNEKMDERIVSSRIARANVLF
jgi:hypothetical protein